jgi:hypothetical protein
LPAAGYGALNPPLNLWDDLLLQFFMISAGSDSIGRLFRLPAE